MLHNQSNNISIIFAQFRDVKQEHSSWRYMATFHCCFLLFLVIKYFLVWFWHWVRCVECCSPLISLFLPCLFFFSITNMEVRGHLQSHMMQLLTDVKGWWTCFFAKFCFSFFRWYKLLVFYFCSIICYCISFRVLSVYQSMLFHHFFSCSFYHLSGLAKRPGTSL